MADMELIGGKALPTVLPQPFRLIGEGGCEFLRVRGMYMYGATYLVDQP